MMQQKSKMANNKKRPSTARPTRPQSSNVSILTTSDFERIRRNAKMVNEEEIENNKKILSDQKQCQFAKAQAHKDRLLEIDKYRKANPVLNASQKEKIVQQNSIIAKAKQAQINGQDAVKEMDQMLKYAKVVSIRDKQREEHKRMEEEYKKKEEKLDLMMELERLKELKFQEDRERSKKIQQREGALIIVDQIKERDLERMRQRENIRKEGLMMKKQIQQLEEEDKRIAEKKRIEAARLAKEVESINKIAALNKDKKKLAEKELDLKIHQYNIEKAKKEEEEMEEKKRRQEEKEKETQRLREKQERAQDKQAELDEIRAQRAYEEAERKAREKEIMELLHKQKQMEELIEANELQKAAKGERLKSQAMQEQVEYEQIIRRQLKEIEEERRIEEDKRRMRYQHNDELKRQIKEREEKERIKRRQVLEEGRETQQELDDYKRTMEQIKREKLAEMERLGIKGKYRVDLEKYKIK